MHADNGGNKFLRNVGFYKNQLRNFPEDGILYTKNVVISYSDKLIKFVNFMGLSSSCIDPST
jgi:hypothetical protein